MQRNYIYLFIIFCLSLSACQSKKQRVFNFEKNYRLLKNEPYDISLTKAIVEKVYAKNPTFEINKPFQDDYESYDFSKKVINKEKDSFFKDALKNYNQLFISIGGYFSGSEYEVNNLYNFIKNGNTAIIAYENFNNNFKEKFRLFKDAIYKPEQYGFHDFNYIYNDTNSRLEQIKHRSKFELNDSAVYYRLLTEKEKVSWLDSTKFGYLSKPLVADSINKNRNFSYVLFIGDGKLILSSNPLMFTNHYLWQPKNENNLLNHLSYVTLDEKMPIFWDKYFPNRDYYQSLQNDYNDSGSVSKLLKYKQLSAAAVLLGIAFSMFILFGIIRKRKEIRRLNTFENTSAQYTEALARLYFNEGNNLDLAKKMSIYFHDHLRNHFYLNLQIQDENAPQNLSAKSGIDEFICTKLVNRLRKVANNQTISDAQLFELSKLIDNILLTKTKFKSLKAKS